MPPPILCVWRGRGYVKRNVALSDKNEYSAATFTITGNADLDLFFTDCSTPSDAIADTFLRLSERTDGPLAVNFLAGIGRTGNVNKLLCLSLNPPS